MTKRQVMRFISKARSIHLIFWALIVFSSCLPEQAPRDPNALNTGISSGDDSSDQIDSEQFPSETNFLQQGLITSTTTLGLDRNFNDSFLIRGGQIRSLLEQRTLKTQQNYCLVSFFPGASSGSNILITSARIKFFFNSVLNSKEYFLQVGPNNESLNQGDCLTVSLTKQLTTLFGQNSFAFKMSDICPSCTGVLNSNTLRLFEITGEEERNAEISFLSLAIQNSSSNNSTNPIVCSSDTTCASLNFDCCLQGQCVNHASIKSGVNQSSSDFLIAQQIIGQNPSLIKDYTHLFNVCPTLISNDGEIPNDDTSGTTPEQQAEDLLTELQNLFNCVTPQEDEFSICTRVFENASTLMANAPYSFSAANDDLNFSNIANTSLLNNIVQIDYAGSILFKEKVKSTDQAIALDAAITLSNSNDSLFSAQSATFQKAAPPNAINDRVTLYYRVDGTCQKLGPNLARCTKTYIQGQNSNPPRSSDHLAGNQTFSLPSYADLGFSVLVKVGGTSIPEGPETWSITNQSVQFDATSSPIFTGQKVELSYFVTDNVTALTASTSAAQTAINAHCKCDPLKGPCRLEPISTTIANISRITSFTCIYPEPEVPPIPLQRTLFLSSKMVPHKFFDQFGVNTDLGDRPSNNSQEGQIFEYTDGNKFKPNNMNTYIGFNEIYGTMNVDGASPLPPKVIEVEKGKSYDVFVDQGAFSSCLNCGTDYYSNLQKIFPNTFSTGGAGYDPAFFESRKRNNQSNYPADDFRFGRACFVPASMIPWTHKAQADVTTQRRDRLSAQHFMFANGYNKDWYGFDYGAVIGSFDGVKWFAIGNQRKVDAEGNKLYLAVNAYFGDLTINNSYKVTINETNPVLNSGSLITHDSESDGAKCQRSHFCSIDEDCITQLGYDYSCVNVSSIQTPWPLFDTNGNEITGGLTRTLASLVGGTNGQAKRCVYRGRGSICEPRSFSVNSVDSYSQTTSSALHTCSHNTYCENLNRPQFNLRIARFADSPANQNIQSLITDKSDTFGLGARILGRPLKYYGSETTPISTRLHLNSNKVNALCVPGKNLANSNNTQDLNLLTSQTREADKISNVGRTLSALTNQNAHYFAACPATDDSGNYTHLVQKSLSDNTHNSFAMKNNLSTNSLLLPALGSSTLFNDDQSLISKMGYHKNTCLRAPGSKCFSDFECAPNEFISSKFKLVSSFNGQISTAEEAFWEEELVCANSQPRFQSNSTYPNPLYDTTTHKCCRETSKSFSYSSQPHENSDFDVVDNSNNPLIPGFNQDINSPRRYSRTHTVVDKLISEPTRFPPLVVAAPRPNSPLILDTNSSRQYNTLHLHNQRMCCTGHWVRKFASGANSVNGSTKFSGTTQQNIPISTFTSLTFGANNIPSLNTFPVELDYRPHLLPFTCTSSDINTGDCEVRNMAENSTFENKYLEWFSKFELIGIPQVLIETNSTVEKPVSTPFNGSITRSLEQIDTNNDGTIDSNVLEITTGTGVYVFKDPFGVTLSSLQADISIPQLDIAHLNLPIENTIKNESTDGVVDAIFNGVNHYSAASYDNFEIGSGKLKKIFSEDQFNCCIPTGIQVDSNTPASNCCSGTVDQNEGITRCCLDDFTDLSVYTNRYVSSEGAFFNGKEINDNDIDPKTGTIKKEVVLEMAATMCCSGTASFGKVINDYLIPINFDGPAVNCAKTRRFLFLENLDDTATVKGGISKFNSGVKWNNHVYCVPPDFDQGPDVDCNSSGSGGSTTQ